MPAMNIGSNVAVIKDIDSEEDLVSYCKQAGVILHVRQHGTRQSPDGMLQLPTYELCANDDVPSEGLRLYEAVSKGFLGHQAEEFKGLVGRLGFVRIPKTLWECINKKLNGSEESEVQRTTSLPVNRAFVYFDVSDFSQSPAGDEALIINALIHAARKIEGNEYRIESKLCIGDGYIFVFRDAEQACFFAAKLASSIRADSAKKFLPVDFHFRIGIHWGEVYSFWDFGCDKWNYVGDAINGGQRIVSAPGKELDDVIFVSDETIQQIRAGDNRRAWNIIHNSENRGRKLDKHGNPWRVHQINFERVVSDEAHPPIRVGSKSGQ